MFIAKAKYKNITLLICLGHQFLSGKTVRMLQMHCTVTLENGFMDNCQSD